MTRAKSKGVLGKDFCAHVYLPLAEQTQSSIGTFLECKQKYVLKYLMRLERTGINIPLVIGEAVHIGFDTLLDPKSKRSAAGRARLAVSLMDEVFDRITDQSDLLDSGQMEKLEHARATSHAILEAWYIIYGDEFASWKFIATEFTKRASLPTTGMQLQNVSLYERMGGRVDGLVKDEDKQVWLLENKTCASLRFLDPVGLLLDHQVLYYLVMMDTPAIKKQHRALVKPGLSGFLYNAIQKPQHHLNDRGFDDLKNRMVAAMVGDPDKYFCFTPVYIEPSVVSRHAENFRRIIAEIDELSADNVTMNLTSCGKFAGCEFRPLCEALADVSNPESILALAGMSLYRIREHYHQELEEKPNDDSDQDQKASQSKQLKTEVKAEATKSGQRRRRKRIVGPAAP